MNEFSIATCLIHQPATQCYETKNYTPENVPLPRQTDVYATSTAPLPHSTLKDPSLKQLSICSQVDKKRRLNLSFKTFSSNQRSHQNNVDDPSPILRPKLSKNQFPTPKLSLTLILERFFYQTILPSTIPPPHNELPILYTTTCLSPPSTSNTTYPKEAH